MSGDFGPEAAIEAAAMARATPEAAEARFLLFGDARALRPLLVARPSLLERCEVRHCDGVVAMGARPREALREAESSSMYRALECVGDGEADAAISAGNTAALMTMASLRLPRLPGVDRPAIAALWPSLNPAGSNVVLDLGADLRADAAALAQYGVMGAEFSRAALGVAQPRVAILNVGAEATKGRSEHRRAADILREAWRDANAASGRPPARFVGFVEGDGISGRRADVIVTDGFTGNVALKTAEGVARLIARMMRETFEQSWWGRLGALAAWPALRAIKRRMDPRRLNGGVFLGLEGVVVKSHGAADAVSFSAALARAAQLSGADFPGRIGAETARMAARVDASLSGELEPATTVETGSAPHQPATDSARPGAEDVAATDATVQLSAQATGAEPPGAEQSGDEETTDTTSGGAPALKDHRAGAG